MELPCSTSEAQSPGAEEGLFARLDATQLPGTQFLHWTLAPQAKSITERRASPPTPKRDPMQERWLLSFTAGENINWLYKHHGELQGEDL